MPDAKPAMASAAGSAAAGTWCMAISSTASAFTAIPAAATKSCRLARAATKPPARMPSAALTKYAVSAVDAAVAATRYCSTMAETPKLCSPVRPAANTAKYRKHRITGAASSTRASARIDDAFF